MAIDQLILDNILLVAAGLSAVMFLVWLVALLRLRPGFLAAIVGFAHLVVAALNTAAPFTAALDPTYDSYSFGLIPRGFGMPVPDQGWPVAVTAAAVCLLGLMGAFSALRRSREACLITAILSLLFLVALGWPWLQGVLDGIHVSVELAGIVIPGAVWSGLLFLLSVAPFLLGTLWGLWKARTAPAAA